MLEMKNKCMKCDADLQDEGGAFICSYECTFCPDCTEAMENTCPNCGGNLVVRPSRKPAPVAK